MKFKVKSLVITSLIQIIKINKKIYFGIKFAFYIA